MAERLRELGFEIDPAPIEARKAAGKPVGRPHLAAAVLAHPANAERLAAEGHADVSSFIPAYLIQGTPGYVARTHPTVEEAIAWIHEAAGVAVWAHPFWDIKDEAQVLEAIDRYREAGLDGVEVFYTTHTEEQALLLADRCAELGLLTTGSSDYHGPDHRLFSAFRAFDTARARAQPGPIAYGTLAAPARGMDGLCVWLTGLSGSGKSTIGRLAAGQLRDLGHRVEVLDGDDVRQNLCADLGFSREDRDENVHRLAWVSDLLSRNGVITFVAAVSPFREPRDAARARMGKRFLEVYVRASVEECERRDVKGLYQRARSGRSRASRGSPTPTRSRARPSCWSTPSRRRPRSRPPSWSRWSRSGWHRQHRSARPLTGRVAAATAGRAFPFSGSPSRLPVPVSPGASEWSSVEPSGVSPSPLTSSGTCSDSFSASGGSAVSGVLSSSRGFSSMRLSYPARLDEHHTAAPAQRARTQAVPGSTQLVPAQVELLEARQPGDRAPAAGGEAIGRVGPAAAARRARRSSRAGWPTGFRAGAALASA